MKPMLFAYVDPGTGSQVAGSLWTFILMLFGVIGAFFSRKIIKPVKGVFNKCYSWIFRK